MKVEDCRAIIHEPRQSPAAIAERQQTKVCAASDRQIIATNVYRGDGKLQDPSLSGAIRQSAAARISTTPRASFAQDAAQLRDVFAKLPSDIQHQREEREISVWFVIVGAMAAVLAFTLSLLWNRY